MVVAGSSLRTQRHVCMYVCMYRIQILSIVHTTEPSGPHNVFALRIQQCQKPDSLITIYVTEPSGMVDEGSAMKLLLPLTLTKEY
jgi:hypothetical protein